MNKKKTMTERKRDTLIESISNNDAMWTPAENSKREERRR